MQFLQNFFIGSISAIISKTIATPFQQARLGLLNSQYLLKTGQISKPYNGYFDYLISTIKKQGITNLYRNLFSNLFRYFFPQALVFSSYQYLILFSAKNKENIKKLESQKQQKNLIKIFLIGGVSGALVSLFTYNSFQLIPINVQQFKKYNQLSLFQRITTKYKGFSIVCLATAYYRAFYFGIFNFLKMKQEQHNFFNNFFIQCCLGYTSAIVAGFVSQPIRNALFISQKGQKISQIIAKLIQKDNLKHFYKGSSYIFVTSISGGFMLPIFYKLKQLFFNKTLQNVNNFNSNNINWVQ